MEKNQSSAKSTQYLRLTPESISQETFWRREKLWFENFAENLPLIRNGRNVLELKNTCAGPCVVVAAGPSVERFNHLDVLKQFTGHLLATDRQLIPLLERKIIPEYVLSIDGDPAVAKFYDSPLVNQYSSRIKAVFNVHVHPSVVKAFLGEKYWFIVLMDDPGTDKSISRAMYFMSNEKTAAQSYGNVGGFAWALGDFLGHRTIMLVGIDLSYGDNIQPMQTMFWKAFLEKRKGRTKEVLKLDYRWDSNPFGYRVLTDAVFDGYREVLQHGIEVTDAKTINCSPLTVLHGPKVHCMKLEEALEKYTLQIKTTA